MKENDSADRLPVYNPLSKSNLGESILSALMKSEPQPLDGLSPFRGAGVYAIYYDGDFPAYQQLRGDNAEPIYVGKAVPKGARKGLLIDDEDTTALFARLQDHAGSITDAENLDLADFSCRYLAVDDIWIPLAESLLIKKYSPVWNTVLDGFGNHDPGKGRRGQSRSQWDTLHPGRSWAALLAPNKFTAAELQQSLAAHFRNRSQ